MAARDEDYSAADTAFHIAIAESCGNLVVPRLMGVLKASVPLFIDVTGKKLVEETIPAAHRGVADAIAARNPTAAHDAMYLHLVYNRNMIAEGARNRANRRPHGKGETTVRLLKVNVHLILGNKGWAITPLHLY